MSRLSLAFRKAQGQEQGKNQVAEVSNLIAAFLENPAAGILTGQ